jgi:hypothetical protein
MLITWATTVLILMLNGSLMTAVLSWSPLRTSSNGNSHRKLGLPMSTTTTTTLALRIPHHTRIFLSTTSLYSSISNSTLGSRSITDTTHCNTGWVAGPDIATKPDYDKIHGPLGRWIDHLFLTIFRARLAEHVGFDSNRPQVS